MLPVYVMIGGRSSRFGCDKSSHPVDGEPWALHVGRRLAGESAAITLVGGPAPTDDQAAIGWVPDAEPPMGPLSGLLAALEHREQAFGEGLLVLASCDLFRPSSAWLAPLREAHANHERLDIAAYRAADRWQPFPSVVHTRWLRGLADGVASGTKSLQAAINAARHHAEAWPYDSEGPPQANTTEELDRLRRDDSPSAQ